MEFGFYEQAITLMKDFDYVSGSRYIDSEQRYKTTPLRKALSMGYTAMSRLLLTDGFTEVGNVKMMKTGWIKGRTKELKADSFAIQTELFYWAAMDRLPKKEISCRSKVKRAQAKSKVNILSETASLFKTTALLGFSMRVHEIRRKYRKFPKRQ
jgi:hypothetical protein